MSTAETHLDPLTALQSGHAYLRLLDAMPVMLWTADAGGVWHHVNGRWAEYTGLTGEARGFGFEEALHPDDVAPTLACWKRSIASGEAYATEYRLRRHDGTYCWFLIRGVRVTDEVGRGVAWVGTCTEIEGQKRAEQDALAAREAALRALGQTLEARDRETRGHTDRVTAQAARLARALELDREALDALRLGAYLHDLGKMAVPDRVLLKPGPLTPAERAEMQAHAAEGERLAGTLGFIPSAALELVRHHHERWDGAGYPDGLTGEAIPLLARVFAVIDVYDALTSERPYKAAWSRARALAELRAEAGKQLDPQVVGAFVGLLED
jgi:PAS domain S-box-containing protein/putative nucleotidyltransferase with HDIG domain